MSAVTEHYYAEQFRQWMSEVDDCLVARVGVTHADLSHFEWRSAFDVEQDPDEAAQEGLEADDAYRLFALDPTL